MSSYLNISRSNYFASLLFIIVIAGSIFFYHRVQAVDTTYTVCASGCDFTSLTSALANPGLGTLGNDTVQITADYVYVDAGSLILSVPDNVTVECLVGAPPFGNSGGAAQINLGSNVTIQDCTFENIDFSATNKTNVNLINDTFSDVTSGDVSFIETNGFKISDNTEIQRIDIRNSDNGIIDNNSFECRFYDNCISTTVSGGSYSISADIPSNIDITNNTITNFRTGTLGDFISLDAGENINFTGNTIKSDVELDDNFVPMLTMQNAEAYIAGNYFLFPEKVPAATNDTWGVNIRVNVANATVVAEHNTFILNGTGSILGGSSCFGVFDDNNPAFTPTISLTADYNLCYNPSVDAGGTGVQLNYDSSSINMIFDNSYNGFYNLSDLINNTNPTPPLLFTSLDGTTTTADPVLRTENVDTLDDYDPVSMSRYLDVNGINDIGALSAVRLVDYLIDDDCVVDYTSCVSNDSDILNTVIKSGDTIEIASGIYPPMTLDGPLNSITIEGAGSSTIFDASGVGSTLTLIDIDDSNINDIKLQSSTAPTITTYEITRARYTDSITTYDQFVNLDPEIPNGVFIIKGPPIANECENDIIDSDGADVTAAVGTATDNWNLVLMDYLGNKLTGFAPNNFISSALDFEGCADPGDITVEYFINDIFTVSGGIFTYNQAVADLVGVSVKLGDTDPPALTRIITQPSEGGILIENSDDHKSWKFKSDQWCHCLNKKCSK
ncbi:MAG: hypothetical protein US50_C0050G0009 [Candidatus Nomurabacteria bacterium GW2011_GWB1_37_5]|uniref:Uncharacterized protein n=1 Tax=Candidatus Nomurabacteria bacterium GW2011_GWB1_37_5 TaxID=1618742 RepID=A0A0G0K180_9BACT|nr:MAG: hypothetical protein US50_C0050G0009 [Candidatus Nomurabacteria bacterium GW2011_GWB1_37_5]